MGNGIEWDEDFIQIFISYESCGWIGSSLLQSYSSHHMPAVAIFYFSFHFNNLAPHFHFEGMSAPLAPKLGRSLRLSRLV
jgi:hypothetical protein